MRASDNNTRPIDAGSMITTTKTLMEGVIVNRSFRKSALLPSCANDTHDVLYDIFMHTDSHKHRHQALEIIVFASK